MVLNGIQTEPSLLQKIDWKFERFVTGQWWWKLRRFIEKRSLEYALKKSDSFNFEAKRAYNRYKRCDFAFKYGKPANPTIRRIVEIARREGVPFRALRILIINCDIREYGNVVRTRRSWWAWPLKWYARIMIFIPYFYFSLLILFSSATAFTKVFGFIFLLVFYGSAYFFWEIYTAQPLRALSEWGDQIDSIAARHNMASDDKGIYRFPNRGN